MADVLFPRAFPRVPPLLPVVPPPVTCTVDKEGIVVKEDVVAAVVSFSNLPNTLDIISRASIDVGRPRAALLAPLIAAAEARDAAGAGPAPLTPRTDVGRMIY